MFIFTDWNSGECAILSTEEKLEAFKKSYYHAMIDEEGIPPIEGEDYSIYSASVDVDFKTWWYG